MFLSNERNKEKFVRILGEALEIQGCNVSYSQGDADLEICLTTIKAAIKSCVVLVADDTDLLVLLLFHAKDLVHDILMLSQHSTKKTHVWSVIHTKQQLNGEVTENLFLFTH